MNNSANLIKKAALQIRRAARTEPEGLASFIIKDDELELQAVAEISYRRLEVKYAELANRKTSEVSNVLHLINNLLNN